MRIVSVLILLFPISNGLFAQKPAATAPSKDNVPVFGSGFIDFYPYRIKDKWGFSDLRGKIVLQPQYDSIYFGGAGYCFAKKGQSYFLLNDSLKVEEDFDKLLEKNKAHAGIYGKTVSFIRYLPLDNGFEVVLTDGKTFYFGQDYTGKLLLFADYRQFNLGRYRHYTKPYRRFPTVERPYVSSVTESFDNPSFADSVRKIEYGKDSTRTTVFKSGSVVFDTIVNLSFSGDIYLYSPYFGMVYSNDSNRIINLSTKRTLNIGSRQLIDVTRFDRLNYIKIGDYEDLLIIDEFGNVVKKDNEDFEIVGPFLSGKSNRKDYSKFYSFPAFEKVGRWMLINSTDNLFLFKDQKGNLTLYDRNGNLLVRHYGNIRLYESSGSKELIITGSEKKVGGTVYSEKGKPIAFYSGSEQVDLDWKDHTFVLYIYDNISSKGSVGVFDFVADTFRYLKNARDFHPFSEKAGLLELANSSAKNEYIVTDHSGVPISGDKYTNYFFATTFVALKKSEESEFDYFDKNLRPILNGELKSLRELQTNYNPFRAIYVYELKSKPGMYGLLDNNFEVLSQPKYDSIEFSYAHIRGVQVFGLVYLKVSVNGKTGAVLMDGTELFED